MTFGWNNFPGQYVVPLAENAGEAAYLRGKETDEILSFVVWYMMAAASLGSNYGEICALVKTMICCMNALNLLSW